MTQPDNFGDFSAALRMREVVAKLVREEMARQRPPARYGKVYDFNRFTSTCDVLFPGDDATTRVKMPPHLQPTRRAVADGDLFADVVRVEGVPGNLWVTTITNGAGFSDGPSLNLPRFMGGAFMHQQVAKFFGGSTGDLPNLGEAWYVGKWVNTNSFGSDGLAHLEVIVRQSFFTSQTKKYELAVRSSDTQDTWNKCAPVFDSGPWSGNDFELEIKTGGDYVELRVRRTGQAAGGFTPAGYSADVWFYGEDWDRDYTVTPSITTDPAPTRFLGSTAAEGKGPFLSPAMHLPTHNQALLSGGGAVSYTTAIAPGILKWTQRFIMIGAGRNHYAPEGYFEIPVPVGSVNVPVYCKTGVVNTSTVAGGVWLENWDALYYEIPYGGARTGLEANFRIVHYSDPASVFQVPSDWVLIATKNGDNGVVKVANGTILDSPHNLSLAANWVALGLGWANPGYRRVESGMVRLEGVAKVNAAVTTSPASNNIIGTLPTHFRPGVPYMFIVKTDTGFGRVDVNSSGQIVVQQNHASGAWLSLDGLMFPVEQ